MPPVANPAVYGQRLMKELEEFWRDPVHDTHGRVPKRLAGTLLDQRNRETQNPYWDIIRQMPLSSEGFGPECPTNIYVSPRGVWTLADPGELASVYSYSICSPGDVRWFKRVLGGRPVIEIGAGGGYWAWQLRQAGIRVRAYDPAPVGEIFNCHAAYSWAEVELGDADDAGRFPDHVLFMSWPSPESAGGRWAADALEQYEGDTLIYVAYPSACATDEFYKMLETDWHLADVAPDHVAWWLMNDSLSLYTRRRDGELSVTAPALAMATA
jgi:hypothetical protein